MGRRAEKPKLYDSDLEELTLAEAMVELRCGDEEMESRILRGLGFVERRGRDGKLQKFFPRHEIRRWQAEECRRNAERYAPRPPSIDPVPTNIYHERVSRLGERAMRGPR